VSEPQHPNQPIVTSEDSYKRFKKNNIIRYLVDAGGITMNQIAERPFSDEDRKQFYQLIGISLCSYQDLGFEIDDAPELKRYSTNDDHLLIGDNMRESPNGEWVRFSDVQALLSRQSDR
jgi:hypothetical protein